MSFSPTSSSSTSSSDSHSVSSVTSTTFVSNSSSTTSIPNFGFTSFSSPIHPPPTNTGKPPNDASTSATLYLYTFLATLVLLLSVSAAIILRSLILRRRHQRMVEEAIRNGTWVPPSPGGSGPFLFGNGGRRVDLTKKPRMWEAFVGSGERHAQRTGKAEAVTEWEWDSIRPFAAAYVTPHGPNDPASVVSSVMPPERPSLTARVQDFFRRPQQPTPVPTPAESRMTTTTTATPVTAAPLLGGASPPSAAPGVVDPPQKVRVAVLIAMPQPSEAKSRSPTPQLVASTSTAAIPSHSNADEDPELPHIEFGIAELDVSLSHSKSNQVKDVRSSVASGSSVV